MAPIESVRDLHICISGAGKLSLLSFAILFVPLPFLRNSCLSISVRLLISSPFFISFFRLSLNLKKFQTSADPTSKGMGGLACALSLAKEGFTHIDVYETASNLGFVGAGIQLAPNLARILDRLGVWDGVSKEAVDLLETSIRREFEFT